MSASGGGEAVRRSWRFARGRRPGAAGAAGALPTPVALMRRHGALGSGCQRTTWPLVQIKIRCARDRAPPAGDGSAPGGPAQDTTGPGSPSTASLGGA